MIRKNRENIKGQRFGYFTIIEQGKIFNNKQKILVKCDCGREKYVVLNNIISGNTKSCGCKKKYIISKTNTKHGQHSGRGIYNIFKLMKSRCYNKNNKDYNRYGGRGIKVERENFEDYTMWNIEGNEIVQSSCDPDSREYFKYYIISKDYQFIKWLVDNDKIDRTYREDIDYPFYIDDTIKELKGYKRDEMIIMLLSIQDNPTEFLLSIIK